MEIRWYPCAIVLTTEVYGAYQAGRDFGKPAAARNTAAAYPLFDRCSTLEIQD